MVEDDRVVARDITQQLQAMGYTIAGVTASGEQAIQIVVDTAPQLVLMDIRLEGPIDGIDAAKQIRDSCDIPIVFLTAYSDEETVKRATLTEPFGYLLKPFEDSQLRTIIEMALYKHGAEQKLRASERRFATTLSSIGDAVIATDAQVRITFMNRVAQALTGWSEQEAKGQPLPSVFRIVNEQTREIVDDPAAKVLRLGTVVGLANHTVLLARDGRELPIDDCGAPIVDDGDRIVGTVIVFRDITEKRKVEAALGKVHAELARVTRMVTIGQLTASIANEINQPIAAIRINATAALKFLEIEPPNLAEVRGVLARITRDIDRANHITGQIRDHIKRETPRRGVFELNETVREVIALIHADAVHGGVSIKAELAANLPQVRGDRVQVQQVLINLSMNAIEAMTDNGSAKRELRISSKTSDSAGVLVTVEDTGPGLDSEAREHLFESFYTTKSANLGMGLSICRSIIESHGGQLWASPDVAGGAAFHFVLPGYVGEASPQRPPP